MIIRTSKYVSPHRPVAARDRIAFDRVNDFLRDFASFDCAQIHFVHEAIRRFGQQLSPVIRPDWDEIRRRICLYYDQDPECQEPVMNSSRRCAQFCGCCECRVFDEIEERYDRAWRLYHFLHEPWIDREFPMPKDLPQSAEEIVAEFAFLLRCRSSDITTKVNLV